MLLQLGAVEVAAVHYIDQIAGMYDAKYGERVRPGNVFSDKLN